MKTFYTQLVCTLIAVVLAVVASTTQAAIPVATLVKDINTAGSAASSSPREITRVGATIYFTADGGAGPCELWRTDGTAGGTHLVKSFNTGCDPFGSYFGGPVKLTNLNGTLVFFANDGVSGLELWKSDGTEAGTVQVKDINPGAGSGIPLLNSRYETAMLNGVLYFAADDGVSGTELWKTDGTEAGTVLVKDIYPGDVWSRPAWITTINGKLFFSADDGTHGAELWTSDGTAAGTVMVKDIYPGSGYSFPQFFTASNNMIFFVADDGASGFELWKTDGTEAGTTRVKDIFPGAGSSIVLNFSVHSPMTDVNGTLFFPAWNSLDPSGSAEIGLWKSDGTEAGTVMVKQMACCGFQINSLANLNGTLIFEFGLQLWKSDGTEIGTVVTSDIHLQSPHTWVFGEDQSFTLANGLAYFRGNNGSSGNELWRTDGTAAGTVLVRDINQVAWGWSSDAGVIIDFALGGQLNEMISTDGTLYFPADDGTTGVELWKSDGTEAGTVRVADVNPGLGTSEPLELTDLNSKLVFSANDGINGRKLWTSDGTTAGTAMLKDITPGAGFFASADFTEMNSNLFFFADSGANGMDIWKTDGTAGGTIRVKDFSSGSSNSVLYGLTRINRKLYFRVDDVNVADSSLWISDGTEAGTVRLKNRNNGPAYPSDLTEVDGKLFFVAYDGPDSGLADIGLWKSNGTAKGTVLVKKFSDPASIAVPFYLTNFEGTLFFVLEYFDGRAQYSELWKSDGTEAGTVLVKTLLFPEDPQFTVANGKLLFAADDGMTGLELWKTNGTSAGTVMVKDIVPGGVTYGANGEYWYAYGSGPRNLISVNGQLVFTAFTSFDATELGLWKSDGTARGTVRIRSRGTGSDFSGPGNLTAMGRSLLFTANDAVSGREELWQSDGSDRGTTLLAYVSPRTEPASPADFTVSGSNIFFAADNKDVGRELWAVRLPARAMAGPTLPAATALTTTMPVTAKKTHGLAPGNSGSYRGKARDKYQILRLRHPAKIDGYEMNRVPASVMGVSGQH